MFGRKKIDPDTKWLQDGEREAGHLNREASDPEVGQFQWSAHGEGSIEAGG